MGFKGIYKMESGSWVVKRKKEGAGSIHYFGMPSADIGLISGWLEVWIQSN